MSKAFTKEDDVELAPEVPRPTGPVWLTEAGRHRLVDKVMTLREGGAVVAAQALALRLEVARVVPPRWPDDTSPIRLGDKVRVRGDQGERALFLVGPDEVDRVFDGVDAVSILSPLGTALIGAEVGDVVDVEHPGRDEELEVLSLLG